MDTIDKLVRRLCTSNNYFAVVRNIDYHLPTGRKIGNVDIFAIKLQEVNGKKVENVLLFQEDCENVYNNLNNCGVYLLKYKPTVKRVYSFSVSKNKIEKVFCYDARKSSK